MSTIWLLMFRKLLGAVNDNPSATPRRCEPHRHRPLPQLHMEVWNMRGRTRVLAERHEHVNDHTYGTADTCVPWDLFVVGRRNQCPARRVPSRHVPTGFLEAPQPPKRKTLFLMDAASAC
jgi:hypothetical protein